MESATQNKMGTSPMLKLIVSMSLPSIFSMLVQSLYNVVDSMFVSWYSPDALTAVSLAFPIQSLLIAVAVGTGVGINSLVSRRLGEGRQEEASRAATHGILLGAFSWVIFALYGIFGTRAFFASFTENPVVFDMGVSYLSIVTIMSFGMLIEVNLEKTLQATGNMIYPMLFQLTGAVTNLILDPIMIFGLLGFPKMGVAGAALATVLGQILAMVFSLIVIFKKKHAIHITFKKFKFNWRAVRDIYAVGLPSIIMQSIGSFMTMGINAILVGFSEIAVSVFGIYFKLQSFVFMPVFGLTHGVMPIMGFNYGAKNKRRVMDALKFGSIIACGIMLLGTLLFWIFPKELLAIFNASEELYAIGVPALRLISLCFVPAAIGIIFSTLFQAVGMGARSLFISVLRQLVVLLPAAYLLSKIGLESVWYAFPIAETVSLAASLLIFASLYRKHLHHLGEDIAPEQMPA